MELLNGLLARYTKLFRDKQLESSLIIEVIKKQTGLTIKNNEIKLKDSVLFITTKPKYKLEIILHKKGIIEEIENIFKNKTVTEIK